MPARPCSERDPTTSSVRALNAGRGLGMPSAEAAERASQTLLRTRLTAASTVPVASGTCGNPKGVSRVPRGSPFGYPKGADGRLNRACGIRNVWEPEGCIPRAAGLTFRLPKTPLPNAPARRRLLRCHSTVVPTPPNPPAPPLPTTPPLPNAPARRRLLRCHSTVVPTPPNPPAPPLPTSCPRQLLDDNRFSPRAPTMTNQPGEEAAGCPTRIAARASCSTTTGSHLGPPP